MSGPPPPSPRRPLLERSNSQNNALAIRIVPYSPPRPRASDQQDDDSSAPSSRSTSQLHSASAVSDVRYSSSYHSSSHRGSTISCSSSLGSPATTVRGDSVSGSIRAVPSDRATSTTTATPVINSPSYLSHLHNVNAQSPRPLASQQDGERLAPQYLRPASRRRNIIALNSDNKTFSLVPQRQSLSDRDSRSPRLSFNSTTSASSDPFTDDYAPSSPLTTLPEQDRTVPPSPLTRSPSPAATVTPKASRTAGDHLPSNSSPWNYRLVGGLRKVPGTPSLQRVESAPEPSSDDTFLPRLHTTPASPPAIPPRAAKRSLESLQTASTTSGDANWKVFNSSPPYQSNNNSNNVAPSPSSENSNYEFPTPSSDNPNYQILSTSSTPSENPNYQILSHSSTPSPSILEQPSASDSDENYVVHAESSPAPSSSIIRVAKKRVRQEYSQESLLVQPLRPHKKPSAERLGFYKQISRESLRHAASLKSFHSILTQDATYSVLLSEPAAAYIQGGPQAFAGVLRDTPRPRSNTVSSSGSGSSPRPPMTQHEQPHQWSSQLSTVLSESEGESDLASRSVSALSYHQPRRGSGFLSTHSRNMLSVSSIDERSLSHSRSRSDPLDRPQPAYGRNGHHEIRDQDEHGDGLTELNALQHRPSRTRLPGFLGGMPDRNLHSSSSSRANSFSSLSLPSWVRLYYGSGERRLLAPSSESMYSQYMEGAAASPFQSTSHSPFHSASPSSENFPSQIFNQRKRPHQPRHSGHSHRLEEAPASVGESADAVAPIYRPARFIKKQTSSIWSPHLRHDHRAKRYSIWEPPAVAWSSGSKPFGRRNIQVVAFVLGFVFPFAWMFAAFLPLPRNPYQVKAEGTSAGASDLEAPAPRRTKSLEELHYDGALWWRRLNRYMSFVGLLVIGAVIALVVLGVREGWGS